jgi:hypothetical protein
MRRNLTAAELNIAAVVRIDSQIQTGKICTRNVMFRRDFHLRTLLTLKRSGRD